MDSYRIMRIITDRMTFLSYSWWTTHSPYQEGQASGRGVVYEGRRIGAGKSLQNYSFSNGL